MKALNIPITKQRFSTWIKKKDFTVLLIWNSLKIFRFTKNKGIDQHSVQFSSVAQSCLTLCDPMNHSTPGLPVHHQLPEFTQTHVHRVGDDIQPSHPLSSPSPPAPNPSQHQGLFQWVNSLHEVAKVLEFQLQHLKNKWIFLNVVYTYSRILLLLLFSH